MRKIIFATFGMLIALALSVAAHSSIGIEGLDEGSGFKVMVKGNEGWVETGSVSCGVEFEEQTLDLGSRLPDVDGEYKVRISHSGAGMAHLDNVKIAVRGKPLKIERAFDVESRKNLYGKFVDRDYDVINTQGRTFEILFEAPGKNAGSVRLSMVGREDDPQAVGVGPQAFPSEINSAEGESNVFTYRLGANEGAIAVDGVITQDDGLGGPDFKIFTKPVSGHPDGYTYGYLKNDDEYLYGTVDFTSDNTSDDKLDSATLLIKTPNGWKKFTIKADSEHWGKPGFTYTDKVAYQHRVYEFKIPLEKLGLSAKRGGDLELMYVACGTSFCGNR